MVEIITLYRVFKIATTSCSSTNELVYNLGHVCEGHQVHLEWLFKTKS